METEATKRKESRSMFGHLLGTWAQCFLVCIVLHDQPTQFYIQVWLCLRADRLAVGNVHGLLPPCHIYYWEQLCYCKGAVLQNQIWHSVWGELLSLYWIRDMYPSYYGLIVRLWMMRQATSCSRERSTPWSPMTQRRSCGPCGWPTTLGCMQPVHAFSRICLWVQIFVLTVEYNHILDSGPQEWEIHNDFMCFGDFGKTMISFTTCSDDQFTCRSGLCVEIGDRKVYITFNAMNLLDWRFPYLL